MQMIKKIKENNTHPGVLLEKNDLSVILLTLLILSILQIWLNLWVCQTGAVLVMFEFGIIKSLFYQPLLLLWDRYALP